MAGENAGHKRERQDAEDLPPAKKVSTGEVDPVAGFSEGQRKVYDAVREGRNVFFTGCAGTGKSHLLRRLIEVLPKKTTFVTAMTGAAALNIGGTTLHKFAGIGLGTDTAENLFKRMRTLGRQNWKTCTTLIVDEVSMMSRALFDKLNLVGQLVRGDETKPFGGLQIVFCGDFMQLPPVSKRGDPPATGQYPFESDAWFDVFPVHQCFELRHVFRQECRAFQKMLGEARVGQVSTQTMDALLQRTKVAVPDDGIMPTVLFSRRKNVDELNQRKLRELPGEERSYDAFDWTRNHTYRSMLNACQASEVVTLRVGAQVMLLRNLDGTKLVNGSRGVVEGFEPYYGSSHTKEKPDRVVRAIAGDAECLFPRVKFTCGTSLVVTPLKWDVELGGKSMACRKQVPLALAWATTIHKSQGSSLSRGLLELRGTFECGQAYVALSRLTSLEGLYLSTFTAKVFQANRKALNFYRRLRGLPLVPE